MKKLLTIAAIALVAGAASAVNMSWGANGVSFGGSRLANDTGVTGYLVAATALSTYAVDASFDASKVGTVLSDANKTSAMAKMAGTWQDIDTDTYTNGDTFAVLLKYVTTEDGKDVTYWNLSSGLVTMANMVVAPPKNADTVTATFSYGNGTDPTLTAGGGWVKAIPVPEPATGALALAGIALLFRRRKA